MSSLFSDPSVTGQTDSVDTLVNNAMSYLGGAYVWGGDTLGKGVDCSGFVQQLFAQLGQSIGRDTGAQRSSSALTDVSGGLANAQVGDLLFFGDATGSNAHVGIYIGNGKMISAENPTSGIAVADISGGFFGNEQLNLIRRSPNLAPASETARKYAGQAPTSLDNSIGGNPDPSTNGATNQANIEPYNPGKQYPALTAAEQQWVQTNAPQFEFMLNDPQLANIIGYAINQHLTGSNGLQILQGLLTQTDWYKTHSAAQRGWIETYGADPKEAARQIQQQVQAVKDQAGTQGINLTTDQANYLATQSLYMGWTAQELTREIGKYSSTAGPSSTLSQLKQDAASYLLPTPDSTLQTWLTNINEGTSTLEQWQANLQQQAMNAYSSYPQLVAAIQRGVTPEQYLAPYANAAATALGVSPDSISFNDPKWSKAIFNTQPAGSNATTSASTTGGGQTGGIPDIYSFMNNIRSDPSYGYQYSQEAKQKSADLETTILQTFGKPL